MWPIGNFSLLDMGQGADESVVLMSGQNRNRESRTNQTDKAFKTGSVFDG